MPMTDGLYAFRIRGKLSPVAREAFGAMEVTDVPAETIITAKVDEKQMHETLALIQDLGLHIVSVQRVTP
jgi:hypothetical protein